MFAEVVFSLPIEGSFHYRIPDSLSNRIRAGCRVLAPFGRRTMAGFVVAVCAEPPSGGFKLKDIREILDEGPDFSETFLSFARKLGAHFHVSWGEILQAALPPTFIRKNRKKIDLTPLGRERLEKKSLSPKEQDLASFLRSGACSPGFLSKKMGARSLSARLSRMEAKGLISIRTQRSRPVKRKAPAAGKPVKQLELDFFEEKEPVLTAAIERKIKEGSASSFYLFGSRAARETAYVRLVRGTLRKGRQVLFLAPEISFSEAILEKLSAAEREDVAVLHSRLSGRRREEEWLRLVQGEAAVVIGARSAVLAPLPRLRLIIVDEEPDESYEQQEGQLYDTRIAAGLRAREEGAVVVFGSSWPSVEAYEEARAAGGLIPLENEIRRFRTTMVDDRREKTVLSGPLKEKISGRIQRGEPVILFINRRGFSSWASCPKCGFSPRCRRCDIALSFHKKENLWSCHYCGFSLPASPRCPVCGDPIIRRRAAGIEAVEEELKSLFPGAPAAIFDSDAADDERSRERLLESFRRGRIAILLGTRLLLHRLDLPPVPLVGILSPEIMLGLSDYRAAQRTSRSLIQAAAFVENDEQAEFVIQTSLPSHYSIQSAAAGDYAAFFSSEIECRRLMNYPPFCRLAEVLFRGPNLRSLARAARDFAARLKDHERDVEVLGPALASVSKTRGIYHIQIVIKSPDKEPLERALRHSFKTTRLRPMIRLSW